MVTSVAIVVVDSAGRPIPGTITYLKSPDVPGGFLFAITNVNGYALWDRVVVPFTGALQLAGAAQWYGDPNNGQAINIPSDQNVTIRVGPSTHNPQDILLPPAVPFV